MADPLNIAGVAGTWVAAIFAIVALIGIVGPFLIFQQTRSERYQALASIDGSQYVSSGLTPRRGYSFFRKGRVPVLDQPPRPDIHAPSKFFAISGTGPPVGHGRSREALDLENAITTQTTSSSTGWVNFASTVEMYKSDIPRADKLVIYGRQVWLPVHRFWLLAFGLRGRYGNRRDKGKASSSGNATRLRIEGHDAEDRDAAYDSTPLRGKLYGFTGTLWWKVSGRHPPGSDEAYFAMHPVGDRQPSLLPDPLPLSTLFWLALGCLPLGGDPQSRVFDLAGFLSANQRIHSYEAARSTRRKSDKFFRFEKRRDFKGYHDIGNRYSADYTANEWSDDDPTSNPGDASSKQWADAMGIDLSQMWCMNRCYRKEDTDEEVAKGLWWAAADPQAYDHDYIWRSDIQLLALAMLRIPLSPIGFLFDHQRTRLKPGFRGAECTFFKGSSYKLTTLLSQIETTHFLDQLPKHERKAVERLWSCFPYRKTHRNRPLRFGRYRTNLSHRLDTQILSNRGVLPSVVQDIVGILTMTSHTGSTNLDGDEPDMLTNIASNGLTPLTGDSFLDLLLYCMADPSKGRSFSLEVDVDANVVSIFHDGSKTLQASMLFNEVLADNQASYSSVRGRHQNFVEFVLAALKALLRGVMFETAVDSNNLLNIVEKMTDVVNVSAESRPPPLEYTGDMHISDRSTSAHTGYTSLLAPSEADSDHSAAIEMETSQPEPGAERETGEESILSDEELSLEGQVTREMENLRLLELARDKLGLAGQIRDLQQELNDIEVNDARKRLTRLERLNSMPLSRPKNEEHNAA